MVHLRELEEFTKMIFGLRTVFDIRLDRRDLSRFNFDTRDANDNKVGFISEKLMESLSGLKKIGDRATGLYDFIIFEMEGDFSMDEISSYFTYEWEDNLESGFFFHMETPGTFKRYHIDGRGKITFVL